MRNRTATTGAIEIPTHAITTGTHLNVHSRTACFGKPYACIGALQPVPREFQPTPTNLSNALELNCCAACYT
jgi:hypothetical protein